MKKPRVTKSRKLSPAQRRAREKARLANNRKAVRSVLTVASPYLLGAATGLGANVFAGYKEHKLRKRANKVIDKAFDLMDWQRGREQDFKRIGAHIISKRTGMPIHLADKVVEQSKASAKVEKESERIFKIYNKASGKAMKLRSKGLNKIAKIRDIKKPAMLAGLAGSLGIMTYKLYKPKIKKIKKGKKK